MQLKKIAAGVALACLTTTMANAGEREDIELVRQTTTNLIEALVDSKVLTREAADDLIKKAQKKAAASVATQKAQEGKTVRVTYVPESVRAEIKEQVKQEVIAQAKTERWGDPGALPDWMDRIQWDGDLRVRYQYDRYARGNTDAKVNGGSYSNDGLAVDGSATRFPDAADSLGFNTVDDRNRVRVRARLGMLAKVTPTVSAGIRLSTGNTTDRVSTNQTLGQNFNKYTAVFDRAYLRLDPAEWLSLSGGRLPNPWFGTDLVWDEDLNFEGVAATIKPNISNTLKPFLTLGAFPMREDNPPAGNARWLYGAQIGTQWDLSSSTKTKFGVALYDYKQIQGAKVSDDDYDPFTPGYTSANFRRYEYPSSLRQKGNTLFRTNAPSDSDSASMWGLASKFRVLNMTASVDVAHWDPVHLVLTGDYARNIGYNRQDIARRTGLTLTQDSNTGWQAKATLGMPRVRERKDWQLSFAYRRLGADAVLDAFTDSDYNLGGTNHKGYVLGLAYGVDRGTVLGLRWLSFDNIRPTTVSDNTGRFGTDVVQVDVTASF